MRRHAPLGLFSVLLPAVLALPVATGSAPPVPHPVRAAVQSIAVDGVDAAALAEGAGARAVGGESDRAAQPFLLTGRKATSEFTLVGVTWRVGSGSAALVVSARTRSERGWSPWMPLEVADDDGPDAVSPEARGPLSRVGTAPQWVGEASGVQVRLDVPFGELPRDVRIELVNPGVSAADASLGQRSAPSSSATAATVRPTIITRAQWGADESLRSGTPSYASGVKAAYVHHTASTNDYTPEQAAQQIRGFYAYHIQSLGWSDIGYNFLVDKFGRVYEGRYGGVDRAVIGAHAGGFNTGTMGVSMIGTHSTVAPTTATVDSVRDLLAWKLSLHGVDPLGTTVLTSGGGSSSKYPAGANVTVNNILGHRDTNNTACPGDAGYAKLPGLRRSVADRINAGTSTAVDAKYASLGGATGFLGAPTTPEGPAVGGRYRHYQGGSIYWSSGTGAYEVRGAVAQRWGGLNWERGPLGFPVTDESGTPDGVGRYNHFQGGSIYWTAQTGAWSLLGSIRQAWSAAGWERGPLRYPITNELTTPDGRGRYNHFQSGSIYWTPSTGAQAVYGSIRSTWSDLGWENGPLGYPLTNESPTADGVGRFNQFQGGAIYWSPATGAREVRGAIRQHWASLGSESGRLGYPTSNEYSVLGGRRSDFQHGSIVFSALTGSTMVL